MTDTLYLTDSYQKVSTAIITQMGEGADGQTYLILDRTIFYPQGGGQPSDKGKVVGKNGQLHVKYVDYNGGEIKHQGTLKDSLKIGDEVKLEIDWDLRHKHMQWHTAGHLVDLIVREVYPKLIPVKGMHGIGKKLYIEYEGIHELDIKALIIALSSLLSNSPKIETAFITLEELKKIANWLPPKLPISKKLRVLSIGSSYHIPDGGTQLKTGESIWPITITTIEHAENSTLIHYQVGEPKQKYHDSNHSSITNIKEKIDNISSQFNSEIQLISNSQTLEALRIKYLGKKGLTTLLLQELPKLTGDDKRTYGPQLNVLKKSQEEAIENQSSILKSKIQNHISIDITAPAPAKPSGHLHPTTQIIRELNSFFRYHGFSVAEGPEIEDVEYNFRRLNLPEGHPATDLQDTLFVQEPSLLMRTHTSSIQTRVLSNYKPPLRVVVPGKVYRNETNSLTNTSFFYQYQGFVVDRGINIQNLKDMLTQVHQFLFGEDVILRYRYKYYPEVSPGMGIDMQCRFCKGVGCQVCKGRGWIETLGSGMTHYNCYKACGIDPEIYTGYSFGMGLDRLVMGKFGITDIRKLYGGELVYL